MDSKTELKRYEVHDHHETHFDVVAIESDTGEWVKHSDALAAIEVARPRWLDIAGVPKDGTEVILKCGNRIGASMWLEWLDEPTWAISFDGDSWDGEKSPTHYQTLPTPPESD